MVDFLVYFALIWVSCGIGAAWNKARTEDEWKIAICFGPITLASRLYKALAGEKKGK